MIRGRQSASSLVDLALGAAVLVGMGGALISRAFRGNILEELIWSAPVVMLLAAQMLSGLSPALSGRRRDDVLNQTPSSLSLSDNETLRRIQHVGTTLTLRSNLVVALGPVGYWLAGGLALLAIAAATEKGLARAVGWLLFVGVTVTLLSLQIYAWRVPAVSISETGIQVRRSALAWSEIGAVRVYEMGVGGVTTRWLALLSLSMVPESRYELTSLSDAGLSMKRDEILALILEHHPVPVVVGYGSGEGDSLGSTE